MSRPSGGNSGIAVPGNERLPLGMGRGRPLATRMESRIGLRRREACGSVGDTSSCGAGGSAASSCRPVEEWLRKDNAVSQT